MDAENKDDNTSEKSLQSQQGSEQTPRSKLRDLRPEKDPMGSGKRTSPPHRVQDSGEAGSAS